MLLSNAASPEVFWQTSDYLHRALDHIHDAAYGEIKQIIQTLTKEFPDGANLPIDDWSMRVSKSGIEIVPAPLEAWMQGDDWCYPGYTHCFASGDTLGWLIGLLHDERAGLAELLVYQVVRDAGYRQTREPVTFDRAVQRLPREPEVNVVLWDDGDLG